MYRRLFVFACLLVLFTLVGCGSPEPDPVAVATAASTETAEPTDSPVPPTETATAAPTETATWVPTNTATATVTETPTEVPTNTLTPEPTVVPTDPPTAVPTIAETAVSSAPNPPPASLPASGAPPIGPNLLVNPGFEYGSEGWRKVGTFTASEVPDGKPEFVRSGDVSGRSPMQLVQNVEPGVTYRLGAWLKIWSSEGGDPSISEFPGDVYGHVCINIAGDEGDGLPTNICSSPYRPIDTWQYITVDAVPITDRVIIFLEGLFLGPNRPHNNVIVWDDVEFGLSPVSATATPQPLGRPVPPAPVAFDAQAMRDSMNTTRSSLEQMGGLLDRLVRGSKEPCEEYTNYYRGLVGSPRYDGVPGEWQSVYNEYIFAVEHGSEKNQPIFDLCFVDQGGGVTELNYGVARTGVNDSLNRLIPAIETTNAMLGQ